MHFFTLNLRKKRPRASILVIWLSLVASGFLQAQTATNADPLNLGTTNLSLTNSAPSTPSSATNAAPVSPLTLAPQSSANPEQVTQATSKLAIPEIAPDANVNSAPAEAFPSNWLVLAALMTLTSLGGFLLYQSGLTRAKNVGHSATLLLIGVAFAWIGYWMGGFAVEDGGLGDAHAALATPISTDSRGVLDHELGFTASGHHWGFMGNSGFFMTTDSGPVNGAAVIFLSQAALLTIAVAAALGASLERARLLAMAVFAFLVGTIIYPLFANWTWGGGWLAELGREYGLGHGFVDLAGAGVVHETAGTLALVVAIVLRARHGRFGPEKKAMPGHNMPFVLLGAILLLLSWTAANAFAGSACTPASAGTAAANTLLAAAGGLITLFLLAAWQKRKPGPALLCRGLLGGAIACSSGSGLIDPWAAFVIGCVAGLLVQGAMAFLEKRQIDDPTGAAATHGMAGFWGVLATGFFANGITGMGINGIDKSVRGLFYGGAWHQLAAQLIGAMTCFVVVYILGYACLLLIQKILGIRVPLADEADGLDFPQTGALGYQGEVEPDAKD